MKLRPIHQNLDTSFVNLSALVRYLRRRQFTGKVHVELSGYEADIYLSEADGLKVREHDRIAGRIAEGEEALQRILIRSREPGGIVGVYQTISEAENGDKKVEVKKTVEPQAQQPASNPANSAQSKPAQNIKPATVQLSAPNGAAKKMPPEKPLNENPQPKPKISLPDFPFELSNRVENKARRANLSPADWQTLLNLTNELLATVDRSLAEANLDFSAAFEKARAEIAPDYPFLNPAERTFEYKGGKIVMRRQVSANLFTASIIESLRRILGKLSSNPKFTDLHRRTTQKLLALARHRKPLYDKFSITKPLEKVLGV